MSQADLRTLPALLGAALLVCCVKGSTILVDCSVFPGSESKLDSDGALDRRLDGVELRFRCKTLLQHHGGASSTRQCVPDWRRRSGRRQEEQQRRLG